MSSIDRQIRILQYLAAKGPRTGKDILKVLADEGIVGKTMGIGPVYADLNSLKRGGEVVVVGKDEHDGFQLFDIDRTHGGKKSRDKVEELKRARERLGPEAEPGLGGLSPA